MCPMASVAGRRWQGSITRTPRSPRQAVTRHSFRGPQAAPAWYCTGKKTPGGAGTHTGHTGNTGARGHGYNGRTSQPSTQTHRHTRTTTRRPKPRPTQQPQEQPQARSRPLPAADCTGKQYVRARLRGFTVYRYRSVGAGTHTRTHGRTKSTRIGMVLCTGSCLCLVCVPAP